MDVFVEEKNLQVSEKRVYVYWKCMCLYNESEEILT